MTEPKKVTAEFSPASLHMFRELVTGQQIPAGHPQLVDLAQQIQTALSELSDALDPATQETP